MKILSVHAPLGFTQAGAAVRAMRLPDRPVPLAGAAPSLVDALRAEGHELVALAELVRDPTVTRAAAPAAHADVLAAELELAPDERVAVLVETDGVYRWHFPDEPRAATTTTRTASLRVPIETGQPAATRGAITDAIVERIAAWALRFVVRAAVDVAIDKLEAEIHTGLVDLLDPRAMTRPVDLAPLRAHPAPRILLFVHGTFGSCEAHFGPLRATAGGRDLLEHARCGYDAVIGYDHRTLSLTPDENARACVEELFAAGWAAPPRIDVVGFSRGGLVARCLAAELERDARASVGAMVFVACTNGGTRLAEPENWRHLVDLVTNVTVATVAVLALVSPGAPVTAVVGPILKGVAALVKHLAAVVVEERRVPGLAAMRPGSELIRALGERRLPGALYVVSSDFAGRVSSTRPADAAQQLALAVADRFADALFGVANDLVVDTASMAALGRNEVGAQLAFAPASRVFHGNYFVHPDVTYKLSRWLGGGTPATTRFSIVKADATTAEVKRLVLARRDAFAIVERPVGGQTQRYVVGSRELGGYADPASRMSEFLDLRGYAPVPLVVDADRWEPSWRAANAVLTRGGEIVGVLGDPHEPQRSTVTRTGSAWTTLPGMGSPGMGSPALPTPGSTPSSGGSAGYSGGSPPTVEKPATAPVRPVDPRVQCHVAAEVDAEVVVGKDATVMVSLSRGELALTPGTAGAMGLASVDPDRRIIVDVVGKRNFTVTGDRRAEVAVPAAGKVATLCFDVTAREVGPGEIWIVFRQGTTPLTTLALAPKIVAAGGASPATEKLSRSGSATHRVGRRRAAHRLTIYQTTIGSATSLSFELDSDAVRSVVCDEIAIAGDIREYVSRLYQEIEKTYTGAGANLGYVQVKLEALGRTLYKELVPPLVQRALWEHRDDLTSIQVYSEEPFIPWELLYLTPPQGAPPAGGRFLCEMGMVRWLHNKLAPAESLPVRAGRALYLIPTYLGPYALPSTASERDYLVAQLAAAPLEPHPMPVVDALRVPGRFDLLHFAGHGDASPGSPLDARVMLEGSVHENQLVPEYLDATVVAEFAVIGEDEGARPFVMLNACRAAQAAFGLTRMGGFAEAFVNAKAGAFVGASWAVGDRPAFVFGEELYDRLLAGDTLAAATVAARRKARAKGDATWLAYVVYGHPDATMNLRS